MQKNKGAWLSRFNASAVVFFSAFIHIALIIAVLEKMVSYKQHTNIVSSNKWCFILIFFAIIFAVFLYYNPKRVERIENKFSKKDISLGDVAVASLVLIPLLGVIILLS